MIATKLLFQKATHNEPLHSRKFRQNLLLVGILFTMLFVSGSSNAQSSSSSGEATGITYKFTVVGIDTQAEGDHVLEVLLSNPLVASCKYFDEAGCFKLTASETLTYQSLSDVLREENLVLSDNVYLSDETILHGKSNLIET